MGLFTSRKEKALKSLSELQEYFEREIAKYMEIPLSDIIESKHGFAICPVCHEEFKDIDEIIAHIYSNKKEFEVLKESFLDVEIEEGENKLGNLLLVLYVCGFKLITFVDNSSMKEHFQEEIENLENDKEKVCNKLFIEVMRYKLYEEIQKRKHDSWREESKKGIKTDNKGYKRGELSHSDLIHRQVAYKEIYLKNREDYPLPFEKYIVHHIDGNKQNNDVSNLKILTKEEHEAIHKR